MSFLSFKNNPLFISVELIFTKNGAFVKLCKYSKSIFFLLSSMCTSERTKRPSVPGRIPTHSSAIELYPVLTGLMATIFALLSFNFPNPLFMGLLS